MKRIAKACVFAIVAVMTFMQPVLEVGNFTIQPKIAFAQTGPATPPPVTEDVTGNPTTGSGTTTPGTVPGQTGPVLDPEQTNDTNDQLAAKFANDWNCKIGITGTSLEGCFVQFTFWLLFVPLQSLAYIAARFLDFFVFYSISSSSYSGSDFIVRGWSILRDLTNFAFIFALLYIAFQFVLNNSTKAKALLINVILVGLAVNFSLFLTQVIVDGGNVLANVFYNQINVNSSGGAALPLFNGSKQIAASIVSESNPQRVIGAESCKVPIIGSDGNPTGETNDAACSLGTVLVQIIAAAAFAGALVFLFGSMGFLFLGRTIGLMFQMVFSPIAFASKIIPGIPLKQLQFDTWLDETIKTSFLAPVYLFFIYLTVMFLKVGQSIGASYIVTNDPIGAIISTLMPLAISLVLLIQGGKVAKQMAGTVAATVTSGLNMVGTVASGIALGAATGGAGMALRGTAGRVGAKLAEESAGKTDIASRMLNRFGNKAASSTFDFRASRLGELAQKNGIKIGQGKVPDNAQGGWTGMQNRYIEEQKKKAEEFSKIGPNERQFERNILAAENNLEKIRDRKDTPADAEYTTKKEALEKAEKEVEELKKAGYDKEALKPFNKKVKDAKQEVRSTTKYKEIVDARKKVADAKKEKGKEEKARKERYVKDLMGMRNIVTTNKQTKEEAKRKILGDVDAGKDDYGSVYTPPPAPPATPAPTPAPVTPATQVNIGTQINNNTTNNTPAGNPGSGSGYTSTSTSGAAASPYNTITPAGNNPTPTQPTPAGGGTPASGGNSNYGITTPAAGTGATPAGGTNTPGNYGGGLNTPPNTGTTPSANPTP